MQNLTIICCSVKIWFISYFSAFLLYLRVFVNLLLFPMVRLLLYSKDSQIMSQHSKMYLIVFVDPSYECCSCDSVKRGSALSFIETRGSALIFRFLRILLALQDVTGEIFLQRLKIFLTPLTNLVIRIFPLNYWCILSVTIDQISWKV